MNLILYMIFTFIGGGLLGFSNGMNRVPITSINILFTIIILVFVFIGGIFFEKWISELNHKEDE